RLFRQAVEPRDVLIEAAAVWSFAMRNPHTLPDDMGPRGPGRLTYALGTAVAHLVPRQFLYVHHGGPKSARGKGSYRYKRIAPTAKKAIGEEIRQTLGLLLHR